MNDNNTTTSRTDRTTAADTDDSAEENTKTSTATTSAEFIEFLKDMMGSNLGGNSYSGTKLPTTQTKFRDLTKMGSYYIQENKVPLLHATGTIDAMLSILKNNSNGDWRSSDALKAAATFIKNDEKVSLNDKTTLKTMVLEITRLGLTLSENKGFDLEILSAFSMLLPLAITRQYTGLVGICMDAVYRIVDTTTPDHVKAVMCFLSALVTSVFPDRTIKPTITYTGELATTLVGLTTRTFEYITPNVDWEKAITVNTETGKVSKSHDFGHFIDVLSVLITRSSRERSLALNFATNIIQKYRSETWVTAFAEMVSDAIIDAHNVVDITDSSVVQFLRAKNQLIIDSN